MALVCSVAQKRAGRSKCGFCLLLAFKYVCSHSPPWPLASTPLSVDLFNYLSPIHFPSRLPISISNWNSYSVSPGSTHIHTHTHTLSYIDLHFFCSATHCLASHCPSLCWPMLLPVFCFVRIATQLSCRCQFIELLPSESQSHCDLTLNFQNFQISLLASPAAFHFIAIDLDLCFVVFVLLLFLFRSKQLA